VVQTLLTLAGIALVLLGLRDMFHTLLHPRGQGGLSKAVLAGTWKLSRLTGHRIGSGIGPAGMIGAIALWTLLQVLGWALIYLPHIPGGLMYSSGVDPDDYPPFAEAVYLSFMTLTTLGYGDIVPTDTWIRLAAPLQALTGFALLTAALTWFSQIYPPLGRRRALASELGRLRDVGWLAAAEDLGPSELSRVLSGLASQIGRVRVDFAQHSEGFYFRETTPDLSLPEQLQYALRIRDATTRRSEPEVRLGAQQFSGALDQLAGQIRSDFVGSGNSTDEVFAAFAASHSRSTD
jgi:hypothetical protein